jgi:arylsulfatase A-like enzyme
VYPTICELTNLPLPSHLDGKSIAGLLRNPDTPWSHPAITTHGFKNHTVRTENWRYIRYANGEEEFYDETADPLEYTNLAGIAKYSDKKQELAGLLPISDAPNLPGAEGGNGKNNKNRRTKE